MECMKCVCEEMVVILYTVMGIHFLLCWIWNLIILLIPDTGEHDYFNYLVILNSWRIVQFLTKYRLNILQNFEQICYLIFHIFHMFNLFYLASAPPPPVTHSK